MPSVSVTGGGGNLTITDYDTSGHTINIDQTATQGTFTVEVDGVAATGSPFTGIKSINVNLGADSDTLVFDNPSSATTKLSGKLAVTAGDGSNTVSEGFYAITGNVTMTEGNGTDSTQVQGTAIGGNLCSAPLK